LQDAISKITRAKWAGGMAQVVECLLFELEALSLNPSPDNNKKRKLVGGGRGLEMWLKW
jgi:hypothetical protein